MKLPNTLKSMVGQDGTYVVDDGIQITVYFDRFKTKNGNAAAQFMHNVDNVSEPTFSFEKNQNKIFWSWSCSIKVYIEAALRVAEHFGFDLRNAVDEEKDYTLFDMKRMEIVANYFEKKIKVKTLRELDPVYADTFESATLFATQERETYNLPILVFRIVHKAEAYKVYVTRFGRGKCANIYVRKFEETVFRPKNCLEISYSYDGLHLCTFYGTKEEDAVATAVLEKFGTEYDFGVLEQICPAYYSLPDYLQYLEWEGTLPKTNDEMRWERKDKERQKKSARDLRKTAREEKRREKNNANDDEMSDQEKQDIKEEKIYTEQQERQKAIDAKMQSIWKECRKNSESKNV